MPFGRLGRRVHARSHVVFRALSSFDQPADQRSRGEAYGKCGRYSQHRVSLDALSCVIQEFFSSIAALFCGTFHYSHAILYYCVGDRTGCAGSLAS